MVWSWVELKLNIHANWDENLTHQVILKKGVSFNKRLLCATLHHSDTFFNIIPSTEIMHLECCCVQYYYLLLLLSVSVSISLSLLLFWYILSSLNEEDIDQAIYEHIRSVVLCGLMRQKILAKNIQFFLAKKGNKNVQIVTKWLHYYLFLTTHHWVFKDTLNVLTWNLRFGREMWISRWPRHITRWTGYSAIYKLSWYFHPQHIIFVELAKVGE